MTGDPTGSCTRGRSLRSSNPILGAVVADDDVAFDVVSEGERYAVSLFRAAAGGAWWKGQWRCKGESGTRRGTALLGRRRRQHRPHRCVGLAGVERPWFVVLRP